MIISHYYCCFLFIRSLGAQQQPLTSSSDCLGIVPAGFFWRHQLPRPTSLPTIWYRFHLLHEGWTEKQPRGKSYTLGVEGLQVNFGKSTNIATFFFVSDLEERWVFLQRPAALSGVPAVLGLARGRRTTPRMDGPPGHQLVPELLLWRQWLAADRYSFTWSKEAVVCMFAVCGHWVNVLLSHLRGSCYSWGHRRLSVQWGEAGLVLCRRSDRNSLRGSVSDRKLWSAVTPLTVNSCWIL